MWQQTTGPRLAPTGAADCLEYETESSPSLATARATTFEQTPSNQSYTDFEAYRNRGLRAWLVWLCCHVFATVQLGLVGQIDFMHVGQRGVQIIFVPGSLSKYSLRNGPKVPTQLCKRFQRSYIKESS